MTVVQEMPGVGGTRVDMSVAILHSERAQSIVWFVCVRGDVGDVGRPGRSGTRGSRRRGRADVSMTRWGKHAMSNRRNGRTRGLRRAWGRTAASYPGSTRTRPPTSGAVGTLGDPGVRVGRGPRRRDRSRHLDPRRGRVVDGLQRAGFGRDLHHVLRRRRQHVFGAVLRPVRDDGGFRVPLGHQCVVGHPAGGRHLSDDDPGLHPDHLGLGYDRALHPHLRDHRDPGDR